MGKPWARYEVGFIDHAKFRALNANAICLWVEGKNYCDENATDGLIPAHVVKQFRFYSKKAIEQLMVSCGPKNATEQFYPLWESHPVGFKMHAYLEYNDCRDEVVARIDRAEEVRQRERKRKAEWRDLKAAKRARPADVPHDVPRDNDGTNGTCPAPVTLYTETETPTETSTPTHVGVSRARALPIVHRRRLDAAWEGPRVYVPQRVHQDFVGFRNHPGAEVELLAWYERISEEWTRGARQHDPAFTSDMVKFWKARYDEEWPSVTPVKGRPSWAV